MEETVLNVPKLSQKNAVLCLVITVVLWSTSGLLIKLIEWNPLVLAGVRSIIAAGSIFCFMKLLRMRIVFNKYVLLTTLAVCVKFLTFVTANKMTASGNVIALQGTSTIFVLLYAMVFKKQKPLARDVAVVLFSTMGISLFFIGKYSTTGILGNVLALGCGVATAVFFMTSCNLKTFEESVSAVMFGHMLTFAVTAPFLVLYPPQFTTTNVLSILFLGVVQQGVSYIVYSLATRVANPVTVSIIGGIEPILNPIWVFVFVGIAPTTFAIIGAVFVIGSIVPWSIAKARSE